jgi:hypothetical protein
MKTFPIALVLIATLALWSCGNKTEEEKASENGLEALQQFADKAKEMKDKKAVDPVDFRKLKELLPAEAAGLAQKEAGGEKNGAMGFTISQANARYEEESGSSIDIDLLDTGGIGGIAMMGLAAWSVAEIDKETADGYEKTTKINGYKGYEKYSTSGKYGEISVFVAERYVVNVKGNNVTMDQLKEALNDIDLAKLDKLK